MQSKNSTTLQTIQIAEVAKFQLQASSYLTRPPGSALVNLEEGFIRTCYIKAIEGVDSYDLDIEVNIFLL